MRVASQPVGGPHWDPSKRHLLLVCDNQQATEQTELELLSMGYTVQTTCDGTDPLICLQQDIFSGVILDLDTPSRGRKILAEIRDLYRSLPVITLTGFPDTEEAVQCLKVGVADYLMKPIEWETVKTTLERWFGERR